MRMPVFKTVACALAMGVLWGAGGCASQRTTDEGSLGSVAKPSDSAVINTMCVVVNDLPVNTRVEAEDWKGQRVGFCCYSCKPRWNAMSEAEKDAAVSRAVAASK